MLNDELRELVIADKNKFIDNKINIVNTLRMFKCDLEDYLNYINGLSGTQCNRISLVMSRDEQAKIRELDSEMLKLIDEIIILLDK